MYEHQELACTALGFHPLTEARRRAVVYALREELSVTLDRMRLLAFGRQWLYDRQLLVMREKDLRAIISGAIRQFEAKLVKEIRAGAGAALVERWQQASVKPRESSLTTQSWLWVPPAKHSTGQIDELLERIEVLYQLDVQHHLRDHPDDLLRRYARRLSVPKRAEVYLEPLIERAQAGVAAVAKAVAAGDLKVDDELHLTPLAAEEEEPELVKLRAALDHRI